MIFTQYLRKADETISIIHDNNDNGYVEYETNGEFILFRTIDDMIKHVYFGKPNIERIYLSKEDASKVNEFMDLKSLNKYDFDVIKSVTNQNNIDEKS